MARKLRVFVENTSQHILLKSINGITLFEDESDYAQFLYMLEDVNLNTNLDIHSFVLMPTYFEFVATPSAADTLSKFMQSLGRKYVGYFNKKYNRTGTLWEGRYKSSLLEDSNYLFEVMRYIESQPIKQKLVSKVEDYKYSSIHKNLFGKTNNIISYHNLYKQLGFTSIQRINKYSQIFYSIVDENKEKFIENCLDKQLVTGSVNFIKNLEQLVGMSLSLKQRGRPKKEKKEKKMYKNLVVLDKQKHKDLKISPLENMNFAKDSSFVPVVANEVNLVGTAFPVVFTADENPAMVSIVSLGGESLAITDEGKWITKYIPSYLRKYPFSFAKTKDNPNQNVILIDEDSSLFSKSKGKQLFKKDGDQSETLTHAIDYLTTHEKQMIVTKNIAKLISDSGILEDQEISVGEGDEKKILIKGFKVINKEKLNELSDDILASWVRKGIISLIDAHLKSLDQIQVLFNIAHQRQS